MTSKPHLRLAANRPSQVRVTHIFNRLKTGSFPNCNSLATELEVAPKTIQRDIDFMRDRLELPIDYVKARKGYCFSSPVDRLPNIFVSESELFALLVAQKSLLAYHGTPYEIPLARAFDKLTQMLDDQIAMPLVELNDSVSFVTLGYANVDMEILQTVSRAVNLRREISFRYRGFKDENWQKRRIQPWHLCCVDNQWYVIGHDLMRKARRNFMLFRMKNLTIEAKGFERPRDFNAKTLLEGAFGVFAGEDKIEVVVDFGGPAARLVKEKTWHASQKMKDLPNGSVRLSLTVPNFFEIEGWVLSWGEHALVRKPPELRESIQRRIRLLGQRIEKEYPQAFIPG